MSYLLAMKDTFRADFVRLNRDVQKRASTAMEELEQDPITSRGNTIKKLRHHEKMWRYRIGDYRLVYAAYPDKHLVQLIAIGPRGEIYERLGYQPDAPDYPDFSVRLRDSFYYPSLKFSCILELIDQNIRVFVSNKFQYSF